MRIGVLATGQHSMFSSGIANTSLAVAEVMREFGHEVDFIQLAGKATWWDDCKSLEKFWKMIPLEDASGYDIVFEIDRMMLTTEKRSKLTKQSIWVVRKPFLLQEMESCLFPTSMTPKREMEGLTEIWMMDVAAAMEEGSSQALELLSGVPVRIVPFVWSPSPAATHLQEFGLGAWTAKDSPWNVHVAETNTTNASSATLPLVILREAKRRGTKIGPWKVHNADILTKSKFFMENIVKHCTDDAVGLSGEFVGRQRCVEWVREPMSSVLSHMRFTAVRPMLLDVAWAGIPLVHNSPLIRDIGFGLERGYYSDNHIGEACDAFTRLEGDLKGSEGMFKTENLNIIRSKLIAKHSPLSPDVKKVWGEVLKGLHAAPKCVTGKTLRVGFCDMWEDFVPEYNFFTLMLSAAGEKLDPPVKVVGGPASATDSVVIFGPFGETWKSLPEELPKIHFTGENTLPVSGAKLNLGFQHFDMTNDGYLRFPLWILEIDWFGADAARIANPKPIPLDRCTKVYPSEIADKKKFCAFVVSNPTNPARNAAFQWLSEYKHVDSAGRLFNNMGPELFAGAGGGGGELKKLEFLKNYKFCLTYENNSARGYVTEKYLHAKAAGCIPIYWGDTAFERDFSTAGCIDAREFNTPEKLLEAVRKVDENDSEWMKRFAVPALDPYRVAWCHRTMAECARRIFSLGGFSPKSFPDVIGDKIAVAAAPAPVAAVPVVPSGTALETPLMVTCATRNYLPSLRHWLVSVETQRRALSELKAIVFLSSDVPEDTAATLRGNFPFVSFEDLPDKEPLPDSFADFWNPQHFGWKLWILNELCGRQELAGKMVFYTDAGAFLCRWPQEWMRVAQAAGLSFLEDAREENKRWCSAEFCSALKTTEAELATQQIQAATIPFRAGSPLASAVFKDAMNLAKRREVITGPKWSTPNANGKPTGHRHDQSILSILSLRASVPRYPLDKVQGSTSLRKTFSNGLAFYVHRGNFNAHIPFAPNIDDAYVINLERRGDRLERLWENCPELKGRVERWSAIDGRALELTPALQRLLKPNDFFWKKAVTGCALSHLGLWFKLAFENSNIENYLILEDDVKFRPGWEKVWKQAVEEIPDDYDIIYLGGVLPPNRKSFEDTKERFNDFFCRVKENTAWGQKTPNRYFHFCAYSYVLSKTGAQKVLRLLEEHDGYWTSADHILCNPVQRLKSYILDPMVAGCYQDDDPKYANSQFNDFSRIDGFDSDLWNNDERFEPSDIPDAELDISKALEELKKPLPAAIQKPLTPPSMRNEVSQLPRRFVCLVEQNLDFSHLHEGQWLLDLFGKPTLAPIEKIHFHDPPPADSPVVVVQRPHAVKISMMLERWSEAGAKFCVLHLSDEFSNDEVSFYDLSGCEKVLRFYIREGLSEKVKIIPLGYHWTLKEGSQNILEKTPRLPFRTLTWSFFGTDWQGRRNAMQPLFDISGDYTSQFFKEWNDPGALDKDKYVATLLDTIFVPCPDGMNPETFRFYEALECGCIPLIVMTEENKAWVDWIQERIQILPLASWDEAANFVRQLMQNKQMLEAYRNKILSCWMVWREALYKDVKQWIQV